jgi:MarR family transcriptional regulator, organic hydroperoxide resistance regulator
MIDSPFSVDTPEASPGFLLWQTTISWQRLIKEALAPYDISHTQFVIMANLLWFRHQKKDVTQNVIINMSKLDKMTVSKSLKKLVAMGLVKRHENTDDARAKSVQLTKQGAILAKKLVTTIEKVDANFFGRLSTKKEQDLISSLLGLRNTLNI